MNTTFASENALTTALAGKNYEYTYTSGMRGKVTFTENKADWEILAGPNQGETGSNDYEARQVSEGVYFLQWNEPAHNIVVTLLINENSGIVYGSVVSPAGVEFDVAEMH